MAFVKRGSLCAACPSTDSYRPHTVGAGLYPDNTMVFHIACNV